MKEYKWVVKDIVPNDLSYEQIKQIINKKIARLILQLEKNRYDNGCIL